jgi:predicted RNase H-like nuclease (RuvC/YqgF family)
MTEAEFKSIRRAQKATIRRISAENTWLRHNLMQMEERIAAMNRKCDALQTRLRSLKKSLDSAAAPAESNESRSKQ